MNKVLIINKPIGPTPFEAIQHLKKTKPSLANKKIAFAGRLDPLAHGLLILLVEPENLKAPKYQDMDKQYTFKVLFGVSTDSYDILGLVNQQSHTKFKYQKSDIVACLNQLQGRQIQPYPAYSSATVKGKPLYWWARRNRLNQIKIPVKNIEIYSIELLDLYQLDINMLRHQVIKRINVVKGNFRQKEVISSWNSFFTTAKQKGFIIAKICVHCSSGTYVRSIANNLGKKLKVPALAYDIKRTTVGRFSLKDAIKLKTL